MNIFYPAVRPPNPTEKTKIYHCDNKLTKFGILVNKTTHLFPSIRDNSISRGCGKILEIPEGTRGKLWRLISENPEGREGHTAGPFRGGGMDIFWNHTMDYFFVFVFAIRKHFHIFYE